jgi:phage-related protein
MMIDYSAINESPIGQSPLPLSVSQDSIAFDGYGLQNQIIRTTYVDTDDLGRIDLSTFDFPRDDGGGVLSKYYRWRQIKLKVLVTTDTAANLNAKLDEMKRFLSDTEWNLDIAVNGETRRIRATVTGLKFDRKGYNLTFIQGDITLTAVDAFFRAKTDQSWLFEGRWTDFWEEISNAWSADADPRFYFIFWSGSSATNLQISSGTRTISVSRTFSAWDILVIDCDQKTVTHNGISVDYSGMFPVFSPGSNPFHTVITGTATMDLTAIVAKNYL